MNDAASSDSRIERTYYPDGTLESETPYVDGEIRGVVKLWGPDGDLCVEMSKVGDVYHGPYRKWWSKDQIMRECNYNHGVGVVRSYHRDGSLSAEADMADGQRNGRLRIWDEEGDLVFERFYINNRRVSKKTYHEACETDATLPRYDPNEVVVGWGDQHVDAPVEVADISLAEFNDACDALEWARASTDDLPHNIGELEPGEESIKLVEDILKQGAVRVLAVNIDNEDGDYENTGHLVVELPKDAAARRASLFICNRASEGTGYPPVADSGQRYVLVSIELTQWPLP